MEIGNRNYKKVAKIDGAVIFASKDGYFLFEEYYVSSGSFYLIPVRLGKTAKEVKKSFISDRNWYYRALHGEMNAILKAWEEVRKLPDIQ